MRRASLRSSFSSPAAPASADAIGDGVADEARDVSVGADAVGRETDVCVCRSLPGRCPSDLREWLADKAVVVAAVAADDEAEEGGEVAGAAGTDLERCG